MLLAVLALAGCGGDDEQPAERSDRAARPPAGWRSVENASAGFTISVPRSWRTRTRAAATLIRSRDRLVAVTVAADRSADARETPPARYARQVLEALPGFEGTTADAVRRVPGSPYRSARIEGEGSVRTSRRPQRITVAVLQRPGRVSYSVISFRNPTLATPADERVVRRMPRTLRGRPSRR